MKILQSALLCILAFVVGAAAAYAQTLAPATPVASAEAFPPWAIAIIVLILIAVAVYVYLKKKDPAELAVVQASIQSFVGKVETSAQSIAASLDKNTAATVANTKAVPLSAVAATGATPGKNGAAGVFSITVTGDPKVDLPAINAAYFGS